MSTSNTKTLPPGIPVVGTGGVVTPTPIAELAKQIGEQLGIYRATYVVKGPGWVRIATIASKPAVLLITHSYTNTHSVGVSMAVSGAYFTEQLKAAILSGTPSIFDKLRFVSDNKGTTYLEVHSCIAATYQNTWTIAFHTVNGTNWTYNPKLYQEFTEGSIPEGFTAKEFTLSELMGGV
ncbi:MAG: hypothetical protein K2M06_02635 [Muribaculaceae bacterium]|nr:hypothetical protein [Muribaculaceae bacterium]